MAAIRASLQTGPAGFAERSNQYRADIAAVFQDVNWMFCNLHVDEEIAFGLENMAAPIDLIHERIESIKSELGLEEFGDRKINGLSGGELRKLAIATALVLNPRVLITDDLFSNLDTEITFELRQLIEAAVSSGQLSWLNVINRWDIIPHAGQEIALVYGNEALNPIRWGGRDNFDSLSPYEKSIGLPIIWDFHRRLSGLLGQRAIDLVPEIDSISDGLRSLYESGAYYAKAGDRLIGKPSLAARNISFAYGSNKILSELSITLHEGSINALTGVNGAGKSTLAKILSGLTPLQNGVVKSGDKRLGRSKRQNEIMLVFQNPEYQFFADTVRAELQLTRSPSGEKLTQRSIDELLSSLDLTHVAENSPFSLSIGERRRLAVGLGLARKSNVLIIDEPTLGQDARQSKKLGEILRSYVRSSGRTVLLISHDPEFTYSFADVCIELRDGKASQPAPVAEFFDEHGGTMFSGKSSLLRIWSAIGGSKASAPAVIDDFFCKR
jgi:energy-coupling factor transport system ATP-binding protein